MASSGSKVQSKIRSKKKRHREKSSSPSPRSSSFLSSSPPLSAKHEKAVYVRVLNLQSQIEWYSFVFNGSGEEDEKRKSGLRGFGDDILVITPYNAEKRSPSGRYAVVGSTIYCVGRVSRSQRHSHGRFSKRVYRLDTSLPNPNPSWKKATSMFTARYNPEVVALNGKIYAFGGTENCDSKTWAEVFDPASRKWDRLISPSLKPTECDLFAVDLGCEKIMVGSLVDDFCYTYDVNAGKWEMLDVDMDCRPYYLKPVAVDTTLFWFQQSMLHAYDFLRKSYSSTYVSGLEKHAPLETRYIPILLNLIGTEFILICLEDLGAKRHVTLLHCIRFCVSKRAVPRWGSEVSLSAFVQSSQTYVVNAQSFLLDAMLMATGDLSSKEV